MRLAFRWNRIFENAVLLAVVVGSLSCDGYVQARFKIISTDGSPLSDALVRRRNNVEHDLARFTEADGCADFRGTVATYRNVLLSIDKSGYQSLTLELPPTSHNCLLVHLAPHGVALESSFERVEEDGCPCATGVGYDSTMAARFKVNDTQGLELEQVEVRRTDLPAFPSTQVTDANGCLGVTWIVPAHLDVVPLVLDKSGYEKAYVEVPRMEDRCYSVTLSRGDASSTSVVLVSNDECKCEMFTGTNSWLER